MTVYLTAHIMQNLFHIAANYHQNNKAKKCHFSVDVFFNHWFY